MNIVAFGCVLPCKKGSDIILSWDWDSSVYYQMQNLDSYAQTPHRCISLCILKCMIIARKLILSLRVYKKLFLEAFLAINMLEMRVQSY